mmetsp:Transcript_6707/g.9379  ORF Transcript_6707/g.9379 Transcript_6707/m.9379 type:complete len:382 (-) Transcript_6707:555-1700(-)
MLLLQVAIIVSILKLSQCGIVFEDDFDTLDFDVWKHEITFGGARGSTWEFQYYTNNRTNSFVRDGKLHIQPSLTDIVPIDSDTPVTLDLSGGSPGEYCTTNAFFGCSRGSNKLAHQILAPIQSARLMSRKSFTYGRFEIVAKLAQGDWLHPSIWMLPEQSAYGMWPASGEIDIVEGNGRTLAFSGTHWSKNGDREDLGKSKSIQLQNYDQFHTFGLYWDQDILYTYIDHDANRIVQLDNVKEETPFDHRFYFIFDVAAGGIAFFPDEPKKPWTNTDPLAAIHFVNATHKWLPTWKHSSALIIDKVTVWNLTPTTLLAQSTPGSSLLFGTAITFTALGAMLTMLFTHLRRPKNQPRASHQYSSVSSFSINNDQEERAVVGSE